MSLFDKFSRRIHYLRVSVTDRCNLRCVYCMPEKQVKLLPHKEVLSFEEVAEVVRVAVNMGIDKVRLTGGEPLTRRDIIRLVEIIGRIEGIEDYAMTTNGALLADFAEPLKQAGLHRINVSLDTIDAARFRATTRGGDLERALAGIGAALTAGLTPIKVNCVVEESSAEADAQEVARFAREKGLQIRFIRRMDIAKGRFWPIEGGDGGKCGQCNRLRLSCDGMVRPCLLSNLAFSVRELGSAEAIRRAVEAKPEAGHKSKTQIHAIGG